MLLRQGQGLLYIVVIQQRCRRRRISVHKALHNNGCKESYKC